MFRVVSRFLSQLWDGTPTDEDKNLENGADNEIFSTKTRNENNINLHGAKFETGDLKKVIFGKVTKLYDNSGLVDDEVYFTFDKVMGGVRPTLNSEVQVGASRASAHDGWRADRVEVMATDWDELGDEGTEEVLIGDVTDINEKYLIVSHDTHCPMASLAFTYIPCKGDWVRAEVIRDRGLVCDVKVVKPLREKSLTGTVTSVGCGHGYINADIFFTFGVCRTNYVPRKGHTVRVTAIESNQGNCKWRAVKVEPKIPRKETNIPNMTRTGPRTESKFTKKLLENKADIVITDEINFPDVTLGQEQETILFIRNDGINSVVLKSVDGLLEESLFKINFISQETIEDNLKDRINDSGRLQFNVQINPQSSIEFKVTVNSRLLGEFNQLVVFNFGQFQIGRYFTANVRDKQQHLLDAKTPYHKRKFIDKKEALNRVLDTRNNQQWVIPGERPMFKQKTINISTKLSRYEIPRTLRQYILNKMDLCCLVPSLAESLSIRNYKERFSALLHGEEVQMELEMREFDLQQVSLKPAGEFLSLAVPGLAEGRPSLLIGDRVILCVSGGSTNSPKYEGFIHEILSSEVLLKFHEDFHATYDMDSYDVMFFFNRTPLRRSHKAVESAKYLGDQVLFPSEVVPKLPQESKKDKGLFNTKLNERQRAAVSRILIGQSRPMPYVLFGPPGTGKTVTLVEAILQIFHRINSSRILACTPSNSAADLIAERLHHSGGISEGDMVRLNAFQRQQNIPEDIENYCTNIEKLDVAAHYRIVICTCTTAGQLHTLGLAPGHFTHVIIDEAGQATEPESLVPISFLAGTEGQIILGGDPYQLGAVLRSPISQTYGLNISLLERLMTRTPYLRDETKFSNHGCYDPLAVTKLINNYRSHEALLELPSRLFYHAEMVPCADENVKNCLCGWDTLPNKDGFPVLFHGVKGEDLREGNSPSWFNAVEAVQVIRYVQELRKFGKHPVKRSDIGIITPYRKQVEKIRLLLDRLGMSEIKVGSVEEFQGQERLVIIISTVRSRENLIGFDYTHNIGFLSNPKRFNVAITRAQALMIVIGNPHVLVQDTNWRALLQYCLDNKSYIGCDLPNLDSHFESGSEVSDDYVKSSESNHERSVQNTSGLKNSVETVCNNVGSASGVVQTTSEENGRCFKNEVELCEEYMKSSLLNSEGDGQNLGEHKSSVEDISTNVGLVDNVGRTFSEEDGYCFKKHGTDLCEDDRSQLKNSVDEGISNNVFEPFINGFNGDTKSYDRSIDDTGGTPMDKLDTVKGIGGSRRDSEGVSMSELDGSARDTVCISMDKHGGSIHMDNLDIKGQDGVSRVNEGVYSSSMANLNRKHDCVARDMQLKIIEGELKYGPRIQDIDIFQLSQSSKLLSTVGKINCFDNETPTQSVAGCEDNVYESSDEDIEEIVYKGDKE